MDSDAMNLADILGELCSVLFNWPGPDNRPNRVFTPGFVVLCIILAMVELAVLHGIFGQQG
ncbi:hypothetical protein N5J43_01560 [Pseudomonas nicosulfuronedens]|uniref:Uncharacterized protein n=2 Tax=Pseudomonas TaxID=286 RepID=A0A5R9R832_9PSED|nr:hypothetical protein [Pseudomonas nicosulfuronedens]MDH1007571.1 hypothetical protein [Pseudomonas nicosulfuronedens]MDH1977616.1 hypothetical protein [Pseudomonas nicosulfuronedens]MDH2025784.1 hypothetical protein [Pseudomonas nicosulfuronedens]TLX79066.1 hypothetical protein FAS41_09400 [Pseudomonas nicosulfuronedens]